MALIFGSWFQSQCQSCQLLLQLLSTLLLVLSVCRSLPKQSRN